MRTRYWVGVGVSREYMGGFSGASVVKSAVCLAGRDIEYSLLIVHITSGI